MTVNTGPSDVPVEKVFSSSVKVDAVAEVLPSRRIDLSCRTLQMLLYMKKTGQIHYHVTDDRSTQHFT